MEYKRKSTKDQLKDAVWNLTSAEGNLKGKCEYNEICIEILELRNKLRELIDSHKNKKPKGL